MCTKLTFFKLFIDMIINYYFKGISSVLDGLNKFFKIINKQPAGAYYVSHNMHSSPTATKIVDK